MAAFKIQNLEGPDPQWTRETFHRVHPRILGRQARAWRVLPGEGVQVQGEPFVRRSPGNPETLRKVHLVFGMNAQSFWDPALFLAVIANESRGKLVCERYESRLKDYSFGPGQFLSATAYMLLRRAKLNPPDKPIPDGGSIDVWRSFLCEPKNTVPLIKGYLSDLDRRFSLKRDPVLCYAAYNAGSPKPSSESEWGLVHHGPALDNISAWYGDACFVLNQDKSLTS